MLGDAEDAVRRAREAVTISEESPLCLVNLTMILARSGQMDEARKTYFRLEEKVAGAYFDEGWRGQAAFSLGRVEEAFELLETAASGKGRWSIITLRSAFVIELMGEDPRYWSLVDRLKFPPLPYYHRYYEKEQAMRFGETGG
jgi:hypothetical protein